MLRFSLRVTRMERIRNEPITGKEQFGRQRAQIEIVWTCADGGQQIYWEKDAQARTPRQKVKRRLMDVEKEDR